MTIVLATRNRKKAEELLDHLADLPITFRTLAEYADAPQVVEDGDSFGANARKKAITVARALGLYALGEDSGLAVDALGGRPGIYSARYAGPDASDDQNNAKLLEELRGVPLSKRTAHYVCHIAVAAPDGTVVAEAEGRCHGLIGVELRGTQGFGYDPLFIIPEYHKTFGELGLTVKRWLSHRARACERIRPKLLRLASRASDP